MSSSIASPSESSRLLRPMVARPVDESHRVTTPLELLFDLTFVAAIAQLAAQLAHAVSEGHIAQGITSYLMVFFAIWWAWMNFTWFASAYDCDDAAYRLAAIIQMGGVIVLAAGIEQAFAHRNFVVIAIGYLIMRVGLLSLWLRAAIQHQASRRTALRYAAGLGCLQILWLSWLTSPPIVTVPGFALLATMELLVPMWAERGVHTTWHPHHIAERYALFTIILLGEGMLAATTATTAATAVVDEAARTNLITVSMLSLIIVTTLWWLYFARPAGADLEALPQRSFGWGYGHYILFAALAAVGAGLEVIIATGADGSHIDPPSGVAALALPIAVYLVMLDLLRVAPTNGLRFRAMTLIAVLALALIVVVTARVGLTAGVCLIAAALIIVVISELPRPTSYFGRVSRS